MSIYYTNQVINPVIINPGYTERIWPVQSCSLYPSLTIHIKEPIFDETGLFISLTHTRAIMFVLDKILFLLPFNEGRGSDWCWKAAKFDASAKSPQLNRLLTIWLADRVLVVRRCTGRDSTESSLVAEPGKSAQNARITRWRKEGGCKG